jgi:hypothetical protein
MQNKQTMFMETASAINLFFCTPIKSLVLCFISCFLLKNAVAQFTNNSTLFRNDRGVTVHMLVQPSWQNNSVFNKQLETIGYPTQNSFGLHLGIGASYLFKTGTSVGLEYAIHPTQKQANGNSTKLNQHLFLFTVKQYIVDLHRARLFISLSGMGLEEQYTFNRQMSPPSSLVNALTTPNTTRFNRYADGIRGSIGITFKGENGLTHRITDFVEMETGYRMHVGTPFYTSGEADLPALSGDSFRQFYIAFRGGLFIRKKKK